MLNRQTLNDYLKTYDERVGLWSSFNPPAWVSEVRKFVLTLDDQPLDETKKTILLSIINKQGKATFNSHGKPSASTSLAKDIHDSLHGRKPTSIGVVLDGHLLLTIFSYLRPEQIAGLMTLNKAFKIILSSKDFWKQAVHDHFRWKFHQIKSQPENNWLNLFGRFHREGYQGMNKRRKQLFSSAKSGDLFSLKALKLAMSDLHLKDHTQNQLKNYISTVRNQALRDIIFHRLVLPLYTTHGETDFNKIDQNGYTLFHWAASLGQCGSISKLVALQPTEVNAESSVGKTPLSLAAYGGHLEDVEILLERGALVNQARNDSATPLYIAAEQGHLEVVKTLIVRGALVNRARNIGTSPLFVAAQQGHLEVVKTLIEHGADVNQACNTGATPLYIAAQQGHIEVVKTLLERGALVNQACNNGTTPLYIAAKKGHLEIVNILLERGAHVNQAWYTGKTPLDIAIAQGHRDIIKLLSRVKLDALMKEKSESMIDNSKSVTLFGKTFKYGYSPQQELAAAAALKAVAQGAPTEVLSEHLDVLKQGELKPLYQQLMRK